MPVTVNELTTEVMVEPGQQLGDTQPSAERVRRLTAVRAELAAIMRLDFRIRAEGFDD